MQPFSFFFFFFGKKRARRWRLRGWLSLSPPKALVKSVVSREKIGKVNGQKGPCLADAKMSYKSLRCKSSVKKQHIWVEESNKQNNRRENFHKIQNFRQISDLFSQIWLKKRHTSLFSGIWREIRKKNHQKLAEQNAKFELFAIELMNIH